MSKNYVIIGSGVAAVNAAKAIRDLDKEGRIMIFGAEKSMPYNRIKLSKELFSDLGSEKALIKKEKWYQTNQISMYPDTKITRINTESRYVVTSYGNKIAYDRLLLCTGSNNRKLTIDGAWKKGVFTIREMAEAEEFIRFIADKNHILTIGGGIQGLETAWSILQAGKQVTIVEASSRLIARQLDERTSLLLKNKIEATGINVYLNASIERILGEEEVSEIVVNGSEFIGCDSVIYSIGVHPNIELVETTAIATNKGIIVDEWMQTNVEGIYAAGDVVEVNGEVEGLWGRAMEQGKVAGANMAGANTTYRKILPVTIFNAFHLALFSIGLVDENQCDHSIIEEDGNESYTRLFIKDKKIVGVISLEGIAASLPYKAAIENQVTLEGIDLERTTVTELMNELNNRQAILA